MGQLEENLVDAVTARLLIKEKRFAGEKGYLFVYRLVLNNYADRPREHTIPSFVGMEGTKKERITRWFADRDDFRAVEPAVGGPPSSLQTICQEASAQAEGQ